VTTNETAINPTATKDGAKQLYHAGQSLATQWARLAADIRALSENRPWGTDEPGEEFNKGYLWGKKDSPPEMTLDGGDAIVKTLEDLGPIVAMMVDGIVDLDEMSALMFGGGEGTTRAAK